MASRIQALLLFSFYWFSLLNIPHGSSLSFSFNFNESNTVYEDIRFERDAFLNGDGAISLTKDSLAEGIDGSQGRASYNHSVPLWDPTTGEVTDFITYFSFLIKNTTPDNFGDGFTFFLSPYPSQLPVYSGGGNLGLLNISDSFNVSTNHIVAVEFDTFLNSFDPKSSDLTVSHIGIDINAINSTVYEFIDNSIIIGKRMTALIDYHSRTKILSLGLSSDHNSSLSFNISAFVDLKSLLPEEVAIGFSACTGASVELHQILSWSFNSTLDVKNNVTISPAPSPASPVTNIKAKNTMNARVIGGSIAGACVFLSLVAVVLYFSCHKSSTKKNNETEMGHGESIDDEFEKGRGPRRFPYSELAAATKDFSEDGKLGEGGFGSVYRGILRDSGTDVAIKRVSKGSKQGKKEYMAEVKIISQLRHRNLVQLIGWCHDHGDFLLVYELMHNGSLDSHLYHKERILTWPMRHKIVLGLGSALLYLHQEWEQRVVHRDIKPSNVMLDSLFNAKLGDFGLARLIAHDCDAQTTIPAGTLGYMAPECLTTGKASAESDVYSFGIVLLEITCGRKPIVLQEDPNKLRLVEWVWSLYGNNAILEAIDKKLNGEFNEQEAERLTVVGLWCAHPDYTLRPSIKQAVNVLHFEAPLPTLPPRMPVSVYSSPMDPNSYTSSVGTSSGVASSTSGYNTHTTNSGVASSSSDSAWLLKQGDAL